MKMYEIDSVEETARQWQDEAKAAEIITTDFIPLNMWMVRFIGLDATLFLSAAYEEFLYLRKNNKTYAKDSIVFSKRKAQLKTGLGEDRQKKAIEVLSKKHLLHSWVIDGIPKKRVISFSFTWFNQFEIELNQFVTSEINKTKTSRNEFFDKMDHIRNSAREAHERAYKLEWEKNHPGQNYDEWSARCFDF